MNEDSSLKAFLLMILINLTNVHVSSKRTHVSRHRRNLIFPVDGSKLQFIIGVGIPVPLDEQSVTLGWVVKFPYLIPDNATQITSPYVTFQRRSLGTKATRYDYYKAFGEAMERMGTGGKSCVLRSICEAANTPLLAESSLGQLLHTFLTPSSTEEQPINRQDSDYYSAELLGRQRQSNCRVLYPDCTLNIFDSFTGTLF